MVKIPHPALQQILEIGQPDELVDVCVLARLIYNRTLLKIAEIEVDCNDLYNLEGRQINKPQLLQMLRQTANWAAALLRECEGPQVESVNPTPEYPYTHPHDPTYF